MRIPPVAKSIAWILIAASLLSLAGPVSAESAPTVPQKKMILTISSTRYSVIDPFTGQTEVGECDTKPVIMNDRTMVPVRVISEGLGFQVGWDGPTSTVTISSTTRVVTHQVGTNILRIEESGVSPREVALDVQSYLNADSRTMLPVRGIVEALGCKVDWNPVAQEVLINFTDEEVQARISRKAPLGQGTSHIPERFDIRDTAELTPVKEQGGTGGCWAFTSVAALESYLAVHEGNSLDLSENNVMTQLSKAYTESYDRDSGSGGHDLMATGYYTSWRGPVLEGSDPFPESKQPEDMVIRTGLKPVRYVQEVLFLPERKGPLDNDRIKRAVMEYGAVAAAMWKGSPQTFGPYYSEETFAWYYDQAVMNKEGHGHAVTVVGWDDTFSRTNFKITPPGDGAFIVRNTKGPLWGQSQGHDSLGGYFHVSYYDLMFMTKLDSLIGNHVFSRVDEVRRYDRIYQHDLLGYNYPLEVHTGSAVSFANVFKTTNPHGELLKAVSFYALAENTGYEVFVVTGFSGSASLVGGVRAAQGTLSLPGYYTVDFEEPIRLEPNTPFAVVVRQTAATTPLIATDSMEGKSVKRSLSQPGESYVWNGAWADLYSMQPNTNVCLKAFTTDEPAPPSDMMSVGEMEEELGYVLNRILSMHPIAKESGFSAEQSEVIDSVRKRFAAPLAQEDYYFEMLRIFAMMGDGHTNLYYPFTEMLYLELPFRWLMDDGMVVSLNTGILQKGDQVRGVGGASPEELVKMLDLIVPHENEYWVRENAPSVLRRSSCLSYLGLLNPDQTVDVEVLRESETTVYRMALTESQTNIQTPQVDMDWRIEKSNNLGYFRFDSFPAQDKMEPLALEIDKFFDAVRQNGISNIAFDWRYNPGGFSPILSIILSYIKTGPVYAHGYRLIGGITERPEGELFQGNTYVLTSSGTFSAAVLCTSLLHDNEVAITVGEPTGGNPAFNRNGSEGGGNLPVTGWHFVLTTSKADRPRYLDASEIAVFPDVPVFTSRLDLVAGRDIQMERLREVTAARGWRYPAIAVNIPADTDSVTVERGVSHSFDAAKNAVVLTEEISSVERVYFTDTATHSELHSAALENGKVKLPATLKPGSTYHLALETKSETVAFLVTIVKPDSGVIDTLPPYIRSVSYNTRFHYFLIVFTESVRTLNAQGITVTDLTGRSLTLREVSVAQNCRDTVTIVPSEWVTKSNPCVITIPANAVVLSSGITNTVTLQLGNYRYN